MLSPSANRKPLDPYIPSASADGRLRQHTLFALLAGLIAWVGAPAPALMLAGLYVAVAGTRAVVAPRRDGIARFLAGAPNRHDATPDGFIVEAMPERAVVIAEQIGSVAGLEVRLVGNTGRIAVASDFERSADTREVIDVIGALPGVRGIVPLFRDEWDSGTLRYTPRDDAQRGDRC
jgi:nitrate reductase NapAB chaperone NapD